ncbi:MAG TPA: glycosyltransferase family 25 protein, partial [Gemmataceae bacterium]|nr:glycosyltransferase family 25 protein [Gemmataceae bacterium]
AKPVQARTPSKTLLGPNVDVSRLVDRVVCLNLDRRHDRWKAFVGGLPQPWPFPRPQPYRAIDVKKCPPPDWFIHEAGQWGCYRTHARAIEDALNDGIDSLLVFEDDATFRGDFLGHLRNFLAEVPDDWELLFLGGCHTRGHRRPLSPCVEIPAYVTLAHAYIVRGSALTMLYEHIHRHKPERAEIDHRLGEFSHTHGCAVYAPRSWLVYQAAGFSDLRERYRPLRGLVPADATK